MCTGRMQPLTERVSISVVGTTVALEERYVCIYASPSHRFQDLAHKGIVLLNNFGQPVCNGLHIFGSDPVYRYLLAY